VEPKSNAGVILEPSDESSDEAWTYLERRDRTSTDDVAMVAAAERSLVWWSRVGRPVNIQRAEWMLARTNAAAGWREPAIEHALRTLALTAEATVGNDGFEDFDFAFAEEVAARAFALARDLPTARRHYANARRLGNLIKDPGDRAEFFRQLAIGPWYGADQDEAGSGT
jgi:hypothetical protein